MRLEIHFLLFLVIFGVVYFGIILPMFQNVSVRLRSRKFILGLGSVWHKKDTEQRWDVFLFFMSIVVTLGVSLFVLDVFFPLQ